MSHIRLATGIGKYLHWLLHISASQMYSR